jgi:hypothetical protein
MSDIAASVRGRLLNVAKAQGVDFNQVLVRFALERILYRLRNPGHRFARAGGQGHLRPAGHGCAHGYAGRPNE